MHVSFRVPYYYSRLTSYAEVLLLITVSIQLSIHAELKDVGVGVDYGKKVYCIKKGYTLAS